MNAHPALRVDSSWSAELGSLWTTCAVAAFVPLPALVAIDPARSADVACVYLGLVNAWLVTEFWRASGSPASASAWRSRMTAILLAVAANLALFIAFGVLGGVRTQIPFPLLATLAVIPAIGLTPWLLRRTAGRPYAAIILGGFLVFACKLVSCAVVRIFSGPSALVDGRMAADWQTAKLMIVLFWSLGTLFSLALLLAERLSCEQTGPSPNVRIPPHGSKGEDG